MLTVFSTPRPFFDNFEFIQRNAIKSWLKLKIKSQIILLEDEKGTTSKVAKELGIDCITNITQNEFGTPIFSNAVKMVIEKAVYPIIAYINTDIILFNDFVEAIERAKNKFEEFLMVGQRMDLEIKENIDFGKRDWEKLLRKKLLEEGKLHHPAAIDYFVFSKNLPSKINLPPFVVGRPYWDGWFLYRVQSLGIPVIDATKVVTAIHQNHYRKYGLFIKRAHSSEKIIEFKRNLKLLNGFWHSLTLRDTNWIMTKKEIKKRKITIFNLLRRYLVLLLGAYPCFDKKQKILFFPLWFIGVLLRKIQHLIFKILRLEHYE